ncbi:MAG: folate family ECF transporter S component [Lachnospiraceae bacterium]|nr:folate family ECF transporter S component [Lachnospiraceae bacterium]
MRKLLALISESCHEFKNVSTVTVCAMFGAISIILGQVASIRITPYLKVGFGALPNELVDFLFGPVVGALFGGSMDIVKFMLRPEGSFMPGYTLNAMLAAFIYGLFLYKRPISLPRMLAAKLTVVVLCNILIGTYLSSLLVGKGFLALLPQRTLKNLLQWPVDSVLFCLVAKALERANLFRLIHKRI